AEGKAETAKPAFGCVHLSSWAGHRDPQRRMRLLIWLGQNCPLRHRPGCTLIRITFLGPHLGNTMNKFIPGFLGLVRVGAEAAQFGPGCRASSPNFEPPAG